MHIPEPLHTNLVGTGPHVILCPNIFPKCAYLERLARDAGCATIYVDADMLYSGYMHAGMLERPPHVLVRRPEPSGWNADLAAMIRIASTEPHLVIVDTLNGLGGIWGGPVGIRRAVHSIMLLAAMGRGVGTMVVAAAAAREGPAGYELTPGGRLVRGAGRLYLLKDGGPVPLADAASADRPGSAEGRRHMGS